jgi:hypothetical protein
MQAKVCPVCDGGLKRSDIPKLQIYFCQFCSEVVHILGDGTPVPLGDLLARNELGDDRVRAAISRPHVSTVTSFVDHFDSLARLFRMELDSASGALHMVMTQIQNRLDFAISVFAGLDMVWDRASEGLEALRAARELVSTLPPSSRSIRKEPQDAGSDQTE